MIYTNNTTMQHEEKEKLDVILKMRIIKYEDAKDILESDSTTDDKIHYFTVVYRYLHPFLELEIPNSDYGMKGLYPFKDLIAVNTNDLSINTIESLSLEKLIKLNIIVTNDTNVPEQFIFIDEGCNRFITLNIHKYKEYIIGVLVSNHGIDKLFFFKDYFKELD